MPKSGAGGPPFLQLVGRWPRGPCNAAVSSGDLTLYGDGALLEIFDSANPTAPRRLSTTLMAGAISALAVAGDYAVVGRYDAVDIVDISDPEDPRIVGHYVLRVEDALYEDTVVRQIVVGNGHAFLRVGFASTKGTHLIVLDVSEPIQPTEVASLDGFWWLNDMVMLDDRYLLLAVSGSVDVYDVADPSAPTKVASTNIHGNSVAVVLNEELASDDSWARVLVTASSSATVYVHSLLDPMNPSLLYSFKLFGFGEPWVDVDRVWGAGPLLYVLTKRLGMSSLRVIDFSRSQPLEHISVFDVGRELNWDARLTGERRTASIYDVNGIKTFDTSDPDEPRLIAHYVTRGVANHVDVNGRYAYLTSAGLRILDIFDPTDPREVGYYGSGAAEVFVKELNASGTSHTYAFVHSVSSISST